MGSTQEGEALSREQEAERLARAPWMARKDYADVRVVLRGDSAMVNYRATLSETFPQGSVVLQQLHTELYVRRAGRWLALAAHESEIPDNRRQPAKESPGALSDYAGTYDWAPSYPDTYIVEGGRLFSVYKTSKQEMFPLGPDTFFARAYLGWTTFVRDANGRVTGYVYHYPDGQEMPAKKIR